MRWQLPARSPLDARVLGKGMGAWLAPDTAPRDALAEAIGARLGARDIVLTDSGTSALALAIRGALAGRAGAAVALPAWNCYDLATAAEGAGAEVVLYDVDPATLGPDIDSLRGALASGVGAIVVAHLYGVPVDVPAVQREAAAAGVTVIEDAAQAGGAMLGGRPLGSFGPLTVLSFGRGKGWTGGGGGALTGRGDAAAPVLAAARASLEAAGRGTRELVGATAQWVLARPALYGLPSSLPFLRLGETIHHSPHPPRAMAASSVAATLAAMPGADAEVSARRNHAALLQEVVPAGFARVWLLPDAEPGWLRLPLLAPARAATAARTREAHRLGIFPGYPIALPDLPGFGSSCRNANDAFAGARELAARLITLPVHGLLTSGDIARVGRWLAGAG